MTFLRWRGVLLQFPDTSILWLCMDSCFSPDRLLSLRVGIFILFPAVLEVMLITEISYLRVPRVVEGYLLLLQLPDAPEHMAVQVELRVRGMGWQEVWTSASVTKRFDAKDGERLRKISMRRLTAADRFVEKLMMTSLVSRLHA